MFYHAMFYLQSLKMGSENQCRTDISFYTIVILLYKLDYNEKLKYFSFLFKKFGSDELIAYAWQVGFTHIRCMKGNEWDKNVEKQSWLMLRGLNEVRVF